MRNSDTTSIGSSRSLAEVVDETQVSVSLFLVTIKMLVFCALLVLTLFSDMSNRILMMQEHSKQIIPSISFALNVFLIVSTVLNIIACVIGIYGFSSLHRKLLAFYVCYLFLKAFWFICFVCTTSTTSTLNQGLVNLFRNTHKSQTYEMATNIYQLTFECCTSLWHSYKEYPESCCPEGVKKCTRETAFTKICSAEKTTLYESFTINHRLGWTVGITALILAIILTEAVLALIAVRALNRRLKEEIYFY